MPYRMVGVLPVAHTALPNYLQMLADKQQLLTVGQVSSSCRRAVPPSAVLLTGWSETFRLSCLNVSTGGVLDKTAAEVMWDRNTVLLSQEASRKTPEELCFSGNIIDFEISLSASLKMSA